ncbi:MAG: hypoxanthine phosphoribosyltransferase [bacterium]|nr:hypoxanthine phosphoribosyltransferase [bacterium]
MRISDTPLIAADVIRARISELARELSAAHGKSPVVFVVVLKGAIVFASDLARAMPGSITLEFVRARSYVGTESTGHVDITDLMDEPVTGKHVVLVEDILDTGRTTSAIMDHLRAQKPARLGLCVLLDKPSRRVVPMTADHAGFTIEDRFVVGYGLDYEEEYRHLPAVHVLEQA